GQDEQQAIGSTRQRAVGVSDCALAFAEIAIERGAVEIVLHRQRKVRQKVAECGAIKAGKATQSLVILKDRIKLWHRSAPSRRNQQNSISRTLIMSSDRM